MKDYLRFGGVVGIAILLSVAGKNTSAGELYLNPKKDSVKFVSELIHSIEVQISESEKKEVSSRQKTWKIKAPIDIKYIENKAVKFDTFSIYDPTVAVKSHSDNLEDNTHLLNSRLMEFKENFKKIADQASHEVIKFEAEGKVQYLIMGKKSEYDHTMLQAVMNGRFYFILCDLSHLEGEKVLVLDGFERKGKDVGMVGVHIGEIQNIADRRDCLASGASHGIFLYPSSSPANVPGAIDLNF